MGKYFTEPWDDGDDDGDRRKPPPPPPPPPDDDDDRDKWPRPPPPPPPPPPSPPAEPERRPVTSARGRLTTGEEITQVISPFGEGQRVPSYPTGDGERIIELDNFRYGMFTAVKRGRQPVGTFADAKNFLLNSKRGSLVLRNGYSSYIASIVTIAGVTITDLDYHFPSATETPSSTDIDFVMGRVSGAKLYVQKPFFNHAGASTNSWVSWGEFKATTINGAPSGNTFTLTAGETANDYYKYWYVDNSTRGTGLWVTGYNGTTKVVTALQNIPTDWATTDDVTLYRWFHDRIGFALSYNQGDATIDPIALTMGDSILASGGRSTTVGNKFCLSTYIDKTLFTGATKTLVTKGTYATEAEIKSTNGITFGNVSEYAATDKGLDQTSAWALGFLLRTDDNQFSTLIKPSTFYLTPSAASKGIQSLITINSNINKRIRYIVPFLAKGETTTQTTFGWDTFFALPQIDLATAGHGFSYTETSGATPGYWSKTVQFDITHWNNASEGGSLVDYLDTTEYTSSTVSASDAVFLNDTLFVANFYDYVDAKHYTDQVRFTGFSQGSSQPNVLENIPEFKQTTIEEGDPSSIQKILSFQGKLVVLKDNSCYYMGIIGAPQDWVLTTISRRIGCDARNTAIVTPYGVMWAKTLEDVYFWDGASVLAMTKNWRPDYRAITPASASVKATWRGWYDGSHKTYNLIVSADGTTIKTFYNMFFDLPVGDVYAWSKNQIAVNMGQVGIGRDGTVYFAAGGNIYKWSLTAVQDDTTPITPYLKTGQYLITEKDLLAADEWYLVVDQDSSATRAGTLDCKLYLDGTSTGSYTTMTKTKNRFQAGVPITAGLFRTIEFEFNSNGTPATWVASASTATPYTIHALGMVVDVREAVGDALFQL